MPQRVDPSYIARRARELGLDPKAVLAVARQEGLGGGIGDNGTSFGPFQLHQGGAYPSSAPQDRQGAQSWAWSRDGIDYALRQIAGVAGGQHGKRAVQNIVSKFERPADPTSEIRGALAAYGSTGGGGPAPAQMGAAPARGPAYPARAVPAPAAPAAPVGPSVVQALLAQVGHRAPDYSQVFQALEQRNAPAPTPSPQPVAQPTPSHPSAPRQPQRGASITGQIGGLNPGFEQTLERAVAAAGGTKIRVDSGYRSPEHNAAVGGVPHSNHMTGHAVDGSAYVPGKGWVPLGVLLQQTGPKFGLRSGNVPGFYHGGKDPVHVDDASNMRGRR